jgi:hypothetical protein
MNRYARQLAVPSVNVSGQSRIQAGKVRIFGTGLDAEICALYLAGAGVGTLIVAPILLAGVRGINSEITVESMEGEDALRVEIDGRRLHSEKDSALGRGSQLARDVLAAFLRGSHS